MTDDDVLEADQYRCADCGGVFTTGRSDDEAHAEAVRDFGRDGHADDMEVVCEDCYQQMRARAARAGVRWGDE